MSYRTFLGMPHSGMLFAGALEAACNASRQPIMTRSSGNSMLTHNFNALWCDALNHRESHGINRFAMVHYDVRPESWWVDLLEAERERVNADILSVIVPIKDDRGLTSTGFGRVGNYGVKRLAIQELDGLPETFSIEEFPVDSQWYLAINTGCWIAKIDEPWARDFPGFTVKNEIRWEDDNCYPVFRPEDWLMSEWAHEAGLRVFATRKIRVGHMGLVEFTNETGWGDWDTDLENKGGTINGNGSLASPGDDSGNLDQQQQHVLADK